MGPPQGSDPSEALSCPHGGLLPEACGAKAKRQAIPRELWDYIKRDTQAVLIVESSPLE